MMYNGLSLTPRTATFDMTLTDEGVDMLKAYAPPERRVTIELARGERWPDTVKRGQAISLNLNGHHLSGRVLYRRMHRMVLLTSR